MAAALGTIAVVVDAIVPVYAWTIGAIRLVDWRRPVHCFRIALVATRAVEITAVIQWLITETHVLVDMRSPPIGRMAVVALTGRDEMTWILAGGRVAVMAG